MDAHAACLPVATAACQAKTLSRHAMPCTAMAYHAMPTASEAAYAMPCCCCLSHYAFSGAQHAVRVAPVSSLPGMPELNCLPFSCYQAFSACLPSACISFHGHQPHYAYAITITIAIIASCRRAVAVITCLSSSSFLLFNWMTRRRRRRRRGSEPAARLPAAAGCFMKEKAHMPCTYR